MTNFTTKNISRLAGLMLVAVSAFAQTRYVSTSTLTSRVGRFSIDMPGQAKAGSQPVDTALGRLMLYSYQSQIGSFEFAVMYSDFPSEPTNPASIIENVGRGQQGDKQLVRKLSVTTPSGHSGLRFTFEKDGQRTICANYMVGARLYQIIVTGPVDGQAPINVRAFFDSFSVL